MIKGLLCVLHVVEQKQLLSLRLMHGASCRVWQKGETTTIIFQEACLRVKLYTLVIRIFRILTFEERDKHDARGVC
jgi:hypothetical protein